MHAQTLLWALFASCSLSPVPPDFGVTLNAVEIEQALAPISAGSTGAVHIVDCHGNYDFDTIQGAIDAAVNGDIVVILPNTCTPEGHYLENVNLLGKAITLRGLLPDHPPAVEATVINGMLEDLPTCTIEPTSAGSAVLEGLTFRGGRGSTSVDFLEPPGTPLSSFPHVGGGVLVLESQVLVRNCLITDNSAHSGAGIAAVEGTLILEGCRVLGNRCYFEVWEASKGKGPTNFWNSPMYGAVYAVDADVQIHACDISFNVMEGTATNLNLSPRGFGAGLAVHQRGSTPRTVGVLNSRVAGNAMVDVSSGTFNEFGFAGGVALVGQLIDTHLRNTLITHNSAPSYAGLSYAIGSGGLVRVDNCTIADNHSGTMQLDHPLAVGPFQPGNTWQFSNTIVQNNVPGNMLGDANPQVQAAFCNIGPQGGGVLPGAGNINSPPLFLDPDQHDYRLSTRAPEIDLGDPAFIPEPGETDFEGDPRVINDRVDMGADELNIDCNTNGVLDGDDIAGGGSSDCDGNGVPDECDPDCNGNGVPDACDISGAGDDCNADGVPDECQFGGDCNANGTLDACDIARGNSGDCNSNSVPDECDVLTLPDCNGNQVPDSCDPDCNNSGTPDDCDVFDDCNNNAIPDECEEDCNGNLIPDDCEEFPDCNGNGTPDDCDQDCNANGTPDDCEAFADCNNNGMPDECDAAKGPEPVILQHPEDAAVEVGQNAVFIVSAEALSGSHQWFKDGLPLSDGGSIIGSQSPTLALVAVQPQDAGGYHCLVTNPWGCASSDIATLMVLGSCPADITGDGDVGPADLAALLGAWGPNPGHAADLNQDGTVDPADLAILLGAWGDCPRR